MNKTQALRKLKPLLGKYLAYREDPKALVGDERKAAIEERQQRKSTLTAASEALEERKRQLLLADPVYQELLTHWKNSRDAEQEATSRAFRRRITIGTASDLFFSVKAEGDNWAEVVEKLSPGVTDR